MKSEKVYFMYHQNSLPSTNMLVGNNIYQTLHDFFILKFTIRTFYLKENVDKIIKI